MENLPDKHEIAKWFENLQSDICAQLEAADGSGKFLSDKWQHHTGGGGNSRVLAKGTVLEKGGVMFSAVSGQLSPNILRTLQVENTGGDYFATGVSIVIHPRSPEVPIIHMNVRYFELSGGTAWFGGGIDLTPHYVVAAQAKEFHQALKEVCDQNDEAYYPAFKKWADDYFFLSHRQETRGVGGIFFDRLQADDTHTMADRWKFVQEVGQLFAPTYTRFMLHNKDLPFGEREVRWQQLRRGRYVEFNLVHDRGTKFGLETNGRTESILVSMPPLAAWEYNHQPEPGSREEQTQQYLRKDIDWISAT